MDEEKSRRLCPQDEIESLARLASTDTDAGLARSDVLLEKFPLDPRLHFLRGSLLAANREYELAAPAMEKAVDLAPDFQVARYQLGFLRYTSGNVAAAENVWSPFLELGDEEPFKLFAIGLGKLARDEFDEGTSILEKGIALNEEHPAMNGDLSLLVAKVREVMGQRALTDEDEPASAASLLLRQTNRSTKH